MFCPSCGRANPDEAKFCEGCGAALAAPVAQQVEEYAAEPEYTYSPEYETPAPSNNNPLKLILAIAIPVVAIALVVGILFGLDVFTHKSEKAVKKAMLATLKGDGEALYEVTVDPHMLEEMLDSEYSDYDDEADVIDEFKDRAEDIRDNLEDEYGDNLKLKEFKVKKVTKYKKDEIKELAEYLEEEYDYDDGALQDVRVLKVKTTIKGSDDDESNTDEIVVTKIKGKWYVNNTALYSKDAIENILDGDDE